MKERKEAIEALKENGYYEKRHGHDHDLYWNDELKSRIPVRRGSDFNKIDRDKILQEIRQAKRRRGKK